MPADLALLRSHLRDQVASIPRAAASAALQPHLSRMFLTVWVGLAQVEHSEDQFGNPTPDPRFSPGLRGHPELTFGGVRNGLTTGNGRHSSNRRHVTLVTAIVTDRYTGYSLSAVVTAVTSVTAVTLASLTVTVGARFR